MYKVIQKFVLMNSSSWSSRYVLEKNK